MSTMDFNELVSGATVRFQIIDGVQYLSIRDFIMIVCEQNSKRAWATWDNLSEERKNELSQKLGKIKFDGRGEREQPGVTFDGALTLMNWLPGEKAKTWRGKTTHILKRYFAGDPTLLDDIQANAASNAPLNQFARASLEADAQAEASIENAHKRQKLCIPTAEEVARCREFGQFMSALPTNLIHYKTFIDLRREEVNVEIMKTSELLKLSLKEKSEHNKLDNRIRRDELKYKKALMELHAPDTVPVAVLPDPATTTTVLKVYHQNRDAFPLLKPDQRKSFLVKAGTYAASAYALQYGIQPSKVDEQGHDVNAYPIQADPLIFQALRASYRDHTAGASQTTLDAAFFRPIHCPPLM